MESKGPFCIRKNPVLGSVASLMNPHHTLTIYLFKPSVIVPSNPHLKLQKIIFLEEFVTHFNPSHARNMTEEFTLPDLT
jgi:hypothetical protein